MSSLILILSVLNFGIAAGYLVVRGRRIAYPVWVYVVSALLFWLPPAIYLVIFLFERKLGAESGPMAARRIALAKVGLLAFVCMQATIPLLLLPFGLGGTFCALLEVCAIGASILWSAVIIMSADRAEE